MAEDNPQTSALAPSGTNAPGKTVSGTTKLAVGLLGIEDSGAPAPLSFIGELKQRNNGAILATDIPSIDQRVRTMFEGAMGFAIREKSDVIAQLTPIYQDLEELCSHGYSDNPVLCALWRDLGAYLTSITQESRIER
jgi:hypothetical protein